MSIRSNRVKKFELIELANPILAIELNLIVFRIESNRVKKFRVKLSRVNESYYLYSMLRLHGSII